MAAKLNTYINFTLKSVVQSLTRLSKAFSTYRRVRGVPIFVIFVTQRKTRHFPPPKITTPTKETVTCAAQEARPSVARERMALFPYQFVQLMPMTVIPSTLFTTATANGSVWIPFSRWHDIGPLQYLPPICLVNVVASDT